MNNQGDLYSFVFRGSLAQDSINRELESYEGAKSADWNIADKILDKMPTDLLNKEFVESATKMAAVYISIAAFENSLRKFIQDRLLEEVGANWWDTNVSSSVKEQAERRKKEEEQNRWHGTRGSSMIFYTQMSDLIPIMNQNIKYFEDYIESIEWARQIIASLERSRNVIMHSGELSMNDIERVGMNIRDWVRQTGG